MSKEICCKISDVLNSFLCTDKTTPSLKRCWRDQAIKGKEKKKKEEGQTLTFTIFSELSWSAWLWSAWFTGFSVTVNFSLGRAWSLGFVIAVAGGLFLHRKNSSVLSYLWIVLKVFSWFLRFWGGKNSKPEVLYDCFERPKRILVAETVPLYCMYFGKIRFRWSTWVWCSGS